MDVVTEKLAESAKEHACVGPSKTYSDVLTLRVGDFTLPVLEMAVE